MVIGDFNAQLLDELNTTQGATGPHLRWAKTVAEEEELMAHGEGESSHVRFLELVRPPNVDGEAAPVQAHSQTASG